MKNYILIPFKNESARLTGKNLMLLPFTLAWLREEVKGLDNVEIYTFGNIETRWRKMIEGYGVKHIKLRYDEDKSHLQALQHTLRNLGATPEDNIIQLQITQPARRKGLLREALNALQAGEQRPIITACKVHVDNRLITHKGQRVARQGGNMLLYDGALYGGRVDNLSNWFTLAAPSKVLINQEYSVIDIDTPEDLLTHTFFKP